MVAEIGWKALIFFVIWFWGSPWAAQSIILAAVVASGIVQVTYFVSQSLADKNSSSIQLAGYDEPSEDLQ